VDFVAVHFCYYYYCYYMYFIIIIIIFDMSVHYFLLNGRVFRRYLIAMYMQQTMPSGRICRFVGYTCLLLTMWWQ